MEKGETTCDPGLTLENYKIAFSVPSGIHAFGDLLDKVRAERRGAREQSLE